MSCTISFIFPHPIDSPAGGYKVVYEYANRLVADGHKVNIVYSGSLFWKKKSLYYKLTNCVRYVQHTLKGYSANVPEWINTGFLTNLLADIKTYNYYHQPIERILLTAKNKQLRAILIFIKRVKNKIRNKFVLQ